MLTNDQKALLKRAQAQAALSDDEYRDAIALVSGMPDCRSSTDKRLTDEHVDRLMSYFEAIYWRKAPAEGLQGHLKVNAVFRQVGYWASKNTRGNTSRDRYTATAQAQEIADLEAALASEFDCSAAYCATIRASMTSGGKEFNLVKYAAALKNTLEARQRKVNRPF